MTWRAMAFLSGRNTTDSKSRVLCSTAHSAKLYIVQSEIREKSMTILTNIGTKKKYYGRIKLLRAEALLYANRLH